MKPFRAFITETVNDLVAAHTECAEAGVPLPDQELRNLRRFHNGWVYDNDHGYVEHNTKAHGSGGPGGYITHMTKTHQHGREDESLPAIIHSNGAKIWFKGGVRHATYLPANSGNGHTDTFYDNEHLGTGKATKSTREEFTAKYKGV